MNSDFNKVCNMLWLKVASFSNKKVAKFTGSCCESIDKHSCIQKHYNWKKKMYDRNVDRNLTQ